MLIIVLHAVKVIIRIEKVKEHALLVLRVNIKMKPVKQAAKIVQPVNGPAQLGLLLVRMHVLPEATAPVTEQKEAVHADIIVPPVLGVLHKVLALQDNIQMVVPEVVQIVLRADGLLQQNAVLVRMLAPAEDIAPVTEV